MWMRQGTKRNTCCSPELLGTRVPGYAEGATPAWMPVLGLGCWMGQDESKGEVKLLSGAMMWGIACCLHGFGV